MDCSACGTKVDTAVRRLPGVADVLVAVSAETMMLTHKAGTDLDAVEQAIRRLGYTVRPLGADAESKPLNREMHCLGGGSAAPCWWARAERRWSPLMVLANSSRPSGKRRF